MKLKRVIKDIPFSAIKGSKEVEILGISTDSRSVAPGFLFIAKKGRRNDGSDFIADALRAGAHAIVTDLYNPFYTDVVQLIHPDVESIEGALARNFYKDPSSDLFLIGVTGTSGKTTVSYIIQHLLDMASPTGLISTIEVDTKAHKIASTLTTPDIVSTNKFLKEMVSEGCKHAVMEVSSIGIDQKRVADLSFDVGVFTNLTPEHLDYHPDLASYAATKKQFLLSVQEVVILNKDSDYYLFMKEGITAQILTYGLEDPTADLYAKDLQGNSFTLCYREKAYDVTIPLVGTHNVYNALAAIGVALVKGIPIKRIIDRLETLPAVPGRLEKIGDNVFVDYAHKPDALANVLKTLREFAPQKLIVVFGCGGDRDPFKRPVMARIAEEYADFTIVTSDNPRSENPKKIIEEIVQGFQEKRFIIEEDRKTAIQKALKVASQGDIVLIAGKGHETGQVIGSSVFEFDDRVIVREMICSKIG